jgi:cell fate regulator YaaT (PSP1 superfamily)
MKVIGVRFKSSGRIYYFDPLEYTFEEGDGVIVETARGQEFGEVAQGVTEVEDTMIVTPLKPVVRPATEKDTDMREQNTAKEGDAFRVCQEMIAKHKLDMHLVSAEYSFNGSKLLFYFTADERVDFRELVKDLASQFRTRIELRQIGVRDEAKMIGGLGSCGRPVCCKTFLRDFHPVSIKMAKAQNLSLSPTKISGLCGRLMCCLQYEQAAYEEMRQKMPRVNREIQTPEGVGTVVDNNVITEKTKVRLPLPDGTIDVREFHYTLLAKPGDPLPQAAIELKARKAAEEQAARALLEPKEENKPERPPEKKRRRRGGRGRSGKGSANAQQQPANGQGGAKQGGNNNQQQNPQKKQNPQGGNRQNQQRKNPQDSQHKNPQNARQGKPQGGSKPRSNGGQRRGGQGGAKQPRQNTPQKDS